MPRACRGWQQALESEPIVLEFTQPLSSAQQFWLGRTRIPMLSIRFIVEKSVDRYYFDQGSAPVLTEPVLLTSAHTMQVRCQ